MLAKVVGTLMVALVVFSCSGETVGPNQRPVAIAGPDLVVRVDQTAELDGNRSYDPDGDSLSFFWDLVAKPEAGDEHAFTELAGGRAELTPNANGIWFLRLTVSDGDMISDPDIVRVQALGAPCVSHGDCDDQNVCTGEETCGSDGRCQSGTPLECDDGKFCTLDGCDPQSGCTLVNKTGPCDDGDTCTMNDQCTDGECIGEDVDADGDGHMPEACGGDDCDDGNESIHPGIFEGPKGAAVCDDGIDNDCDGQTDLDDPACSVCTQDADCDDGDYCNGEETCDQNGVPPGTCQPGTAPCADSVDCTTDACDEGSDTCSFTPDDSFCEDGDVCNGAEVCNQQSGCQAGPNAPVDTPCDNGDSCPNDTCDGNGNCRSGPALDGDGDGYLDAACGGLDCDDTNPSIHPGRPEGPICDASLACHDGRDNNCDGNTDAADVGCQATGYICVFGPTNPVPTGSSDTVTVALDGPGYDPEKIVCYTDNSRLLAGEVLFSNDFESNLDGFSISDPSRVVRTSAAQNPASTGFNGAYIFHNGQPGWMQSDRIDTSGRTRILLRYASRVVETESDQGIENFITEYSPDDGASWYVLDIQGDGLNQYYFQWFSHILPESCENNPNLRIRFRMYEGGTPNEGGHVDDLQVIDLPEPTVWWTMLSNRFETSEGNSQADICDNETVVHFGVQVPPGRVCLRQDAQNPASADANNTQGVRISGEETWLEAGGWNMWYIPYGSDLVFSFFMDDVNLPLAGYANAWYLYLGTWRRMNGVGVDTTVEAGSRVHFIWDPETIGQWVDVRFWLPWSVNDVTDSHHITVDDFDLTWYRASHDVVGSFSDQGDGSYTASIISDLPGTANVTCVYYGNDPPWFTDGIGNNSGPWGVEFQ